MAGDLFDFIDKEIAARVRFSASTGSGLSGNDNKKNESRDIDTNRLCQRCTSAPVKGDRRLCPACLQ